MNIHLITIGEPKLAYAKLGWQEYVKRLNHYHKVRVTALSDRHNDAAHLLKAVTNTILVALVIDGHQFTSQQLAAFLEQRALDGREVSFVIGGPEGLPQSVIDTADYRWSLSQLTFPHDLAMVIMAETLYRASTINAGQPYHK